MKDKGPFGCAAKEWGTGHPDSVAYQTAERPDRCLQDAHSPN